MQKRTTDTHSSQAAALQFTEFDSALPRGICAMTLGQAVGMPPVLEESLTDWQTAVKVDLLFRICGVDASVTPLEARFAWDETTCYALFRCADPGPEVLAAKRLDQVELFLCRDYSHAHGYEQFTIRNSGQVTGVRFSPEQPQPETVDGAIGQVLRRPGEWIAQLTIPWSLIGGKPATAFGLLLLRDRQQYGEVTSPVALDRRWQQDPLTFIETTLGGTPGTKSEAGSLITLPSGRLCWQGVAVITWPSPAERQLLWHMQQQLLASTTPETLAARLYLAQRWHDVLRLEGYCFDPAQTVLWSLQPYEYSPESARTAVNTALANNDLPAACKVVDTLLTQYDAASRHWYADESPGNIDADAWTTLDAIDSITPREHDIEMCGHAGKTPVRLYLSCPALGGVRLHAEATGFFHPNAWAELQVNSGDDGSTIISGIDCTIAVQRTAPWSITVTDHATQQARWQLQQGDIAFRFAPGGRVLAVDVQWSLAADEGIYGLGERFNTVNQRGEVASLWAFDAWEATSSFGFENQAYKIVPLLHSTHGYSLFFNSSYRLRADVGNADSQRCRLTAHGPVLDLFLWTTPPAQAMMAYTSLTGKPLLPPRWVFEPWAGGGGGRWSSGPAKDATQEIINVMSRFRELYIPHAGIYAEGDASADPRLYTALAPFDLHIFTWGRSQVWGRYDKYLPDVPEQDWPLLRKADGTPVQYPRDNPIAGHFPYLDFTHPRAIEVLRAFWQRHLDYGVAGSMVDFGDLVPEDAQFYDGRGGEAMHNLYAYDYHRVFNQLYRERRRDDFVLFSRGAAPGSQAFVCQFAGDHETNFYGMAAALRGGLNLAASGFPFWGCDIGGYAGQPDEEIYTRWVQWGAFSPIMRAHGTVPREPWEYSDETVRIYKKYAWVRENLLDYLYSAAVAAHRTGLPMMRPLPLAYPDQQLDVRDDEYLLGNDLLVAPVLTSGDTRRVLFPAGRWTSLWNGVTLTGGSEETISAPLDEIPVYLREGAIIPLRLNPQLTLGESLSNGQVSALLLTPPVAPTTAQCWQSAEHRAQCATTPLPDGFTVQLDDFHDTHYLLLYGLPSAVAHVHANGVELPHLEDEKFHTLPPGWYQDGALRTVVRIPHGIKQSIEIRLE